MSAWTNWVIDAAYSTLRTQVGLEGNSVALRALGGGRLEGSELARFAYLDEAGISDNEPWMVVAGILVHGDDQLNKLYTDLEAIIERYIPPEYREGLVLHACDIYGGYGKTFDKRKNPYWTAERRMPIMEALAEIVRASRVIVTSAWLERAKLEPERMELPDDGPKASLSVRAHAVLYCTCLLEVDLWLRKYGRRENCMVIAEDNEEARGVIRYVHRFHQNKSLIFDDDLKPLFPYQRIREDPAFQEKRPSNPLVLADFIAFVIKRGLMRDPRIAPYFDPWKERIFEASYSKLVAPSE